ncbi:MAG: hypothetical protein CFE32_03475 [Alphaproteobacteria bacterium PA3]|nr:MAG: hypothetical protein CFE32_03475 [Alphaproteobacteria bacterium PA3]
MKMITRLAAGAALVMAMTMGAAAPAMAQESSYKPGSVFEVSYIEVLPGQFENYMDYLSDRWKKSNEFLKKEGVVLSYRVLAINNARDGEPTLMLMIEYKDYTTNAQKDAIGKKLNEYMTQTDRSSETAAAARGKMREQKGSIELQELVLK